MKRNIVIFSALVLMLIFFSESGIVGSTIATMNHKEQIEEFPNRPPTMIVPTSVGGSLDLLARTLGVQSSKYLGQPLIIENITGSVRGWDYLIDSQANGYTLAIVAPGTVIQPIITCTTRYKYIEKIDPIAQITSPPMVLSVRTDQRWENLDDLIKYAKENPGKVTFGHVGLGAIRHVAGEIFAKKAGIEIGDSSYNGGTEEIAALLGKRVQFIITDPSEVREFIKYGSVKALAVSSEKRLTDTEFKDVPTFKEKGLDVVLEQWIGIGVAKNVPENEKKKLVDSFKQIINDPEFEKSMNKAGMTVTYLTPELFFEKWTKEDERYKKIFEELPINWF